MSVGHAESVRFHAFHRLAYIPSATTRSAWVPCSMMRPESITTIRCARTSVSG